jgi:alkylated DNA repair dioxygenase AlkB
MLLAGAREVIELQGGTLQLWSRFLGQGEAADYLARLRAEIPWHQSRIRIAGREIPIPRLNAWYGDLGADYGYSGIRLATQGWTASLAGLKQRVEAVCGEGFNSALANLYRDHRDSVDWHSDDEPELGLNPVVASLSLGETRRFELRRVDDHRQRCVLELPGGSLLLMTGALQHQWQHRVGKERLPCGERINLTFRTVVTGA